jgi:sugar/nucleoside kinase (ribokinase family)
MKPVFPESLFKPADRRQGVLCAGLWLVDYLKEIDHYPSPSRLAKISGVARSNGGGAFNVAVDLAKLGGSFPIQSAGVVGRDADGDWIEAHCRSYNIDTTGLRRHPAQPTSFTDVMTERGSGRRTFFYQPGANEWFEAGNVDLNSNARLLYLGYPGLLPRLDARDEESGRSGLDQLLAAATANGFVTAADLVSADQLDWELQAQALPGLDLLFANELEAAKLLGEQGPADMPAAEPGRMAKALARMGKALIERGVRKAVVLHAEGGAVCVERGGGIFARGAVAVPEAGIKGTCGAGDAVAAGFLFGFHEGWASDRSLELGLCAAATCLSQVSSSGGILRWDECLRRGGQLGFNSFTP